MPARCGRILKRPCYVSLSIVDFEKIFYQFCKWVVMGFDRNNVFQSTLGYGPTYMNFNEIIVFQASFLSDMSMF